MTLLLLILVAVLTVWVTAISAYTIKLRGLISRLDAKLAEHLALDPRYKGPSEP